MTTYQPNTQQVPSNQVLLVVHQPTLGHRLPRFSSTRAYLNRGAQFSNGCQCFLPQMLLLIVLGSLFTFMGLSILAIRGAGRRGDAYARRWAAGCWPVPYPHCQEAVQQSSCKPS
ncbi:uncharacterized protein LOC135104042 isoform X2 [Scylla paramamosain]|uniref:uncharacterized protein LOC135104042 isoform X2 n=1 Tax=Scylla paramamosain TaxID=85552 RepID=UPI003082D8BF